MKRQTQLGIFAVTIALSAGVFSGCASSEVRPAPSPSSSSSKPFPPFAVYQDRQPKRTHYTPSGYMGDSDLTLSGAFTQTPHGQGTCLKASYKASGPKGWAGIYWQDPANNWGDAPGRAGYDLRGATRLTFWARGEEGGEKVHEFRVGGIVGPYPDSDVATLSNVRLSKEWKEYSIDLSKKDLRHIIGGFGFSVLKAENPGGLTFYIDDIVFEGPQGQPAMTTSSMTLQGEEPGQVKVSTPTVTVSTLVPAVPPVAVSTEPTKEMVVQEVETGLKVSFSSRLLFAPGQSDLDSSAGRVLDQLIQLLSAYPSNNVLIEGHTDNTGGKALNQKLSEKRAEAVRDYLIKHGKYDPARFRTVGYGETRPIASNVTRQGRALNRRVEVTILKAQ